MREIRVPPCDEDDCDRIVLRLEPATVPVISLEDITRRVQEELRRRSQEPTPAA